VTGVTGARRAFEDGLRSRVERVRKATALPVGVGFGISTPKQAAWIAGFADAAVVGSALVERIERARGSDQKAMQAGKFIALLKHAIRRAAAKKTRQRAPGLGQREASRGQGTASSK